MARLRSRRLLSPPWLALHALALALVVAFLWLGWWQIRRAAAGNLLSYAYAVEWPVFAAFVVLLWLKEVRAVLRPPAPNSDEPPPTPQPAADGYIPFSAAVARPQAPGDDADPELAAYNRYLAWLAANPDRRPEEYAG